jgi:coniferyl-aldehyde dehydrogenase
MSDDAAIIELEASLAIQKKVFLQNQYPSLQERQRNVGKIAEMVLRNRDPIREALKSDFGNHPTVTTDLMEVLGVAGRAGYVASQIEKWMVHDDRDVDTQLFGAGKAQVRYQPKGVVGIISRIFFHLISCARYR